MKKAFIFIGDRGSGKTKFAKLALSKFGDKAVYLDGGIFNPSNSYFFNECTSETKLIIIDDLKQDYLFHFLENISKSEITINKKGEKPYKAKIERFIFILDSDTIDFNNNASFTRRFEIIRFPIVDTINLIQKINTND